MIETVDNDDSNFEKENADHNDLDGSSKSTFISELTIAVNGSKESVDENEDLVFLRQNNRPMVNKSAYSKLHRISKSRLSSHSLSKYETLSKSLEKPSVQIAETKKLDAKYKLSDDEEDIFIPCIIRKSESVDTVDKIEQELSNFIMDTSRKKEKKRTNSFRKFFSVSFFGKDKKKKELKQDVNSSQNSDYADNYHNETNCNSFVRNSSQRHTVNCGHVRSDPQLGTRHIPRKSIEEDPPPEVLRKYADNHINRFHKIRQSFEYPDKFNRTSEGSNIPQPNQAVVASSNIKYIDTSSSTSTLESQNQNTYQNALIAQAELQRIQQDKKLALMDDRYRLARSDSLRRDTPPRAQEIHQPVNIVKPKARLPINSGRPLPNPYHYEVELINKQGDNHFQKLHHESSPESEISPSPKLNELYGTVFDAININKSREPINQKYLNSLSSRTSLSPIPKSPRSPSLEISKLKLPPNREITPLQPRMRSPLPPAKVSPEKLIATELLKNYLTSDDTDHTPVDMSEQKGMSNRLMLNPQATSTPENRTSVSEAINALRTKLEANDQNLKQELDEIRSTLQNLTNIEPASRNLVSNEIKPKENAFFGTGSPRGTLIPSSRSSATISPSLLNRSSQASSGTSLVPIVRPTNSPEETNHADSPDVELRQKKNVPNYRGPGTYSPSSPTKDEIRRSVEAYYWKEIKKIKEKEDYEIYLSQLHFAQGGYVEDPSLPRRSRGMDQRGRRSLSVPRNVRHLSFDGQNDVRLRRFPIPEGKTVLYDTNTQCIYGYVNPRISKTKTSPQNRSEQLIVASQNQNNGDYGTYKPIFRRGSLTGSVSQPLQTNKKVSFSNSKQSENLCEWPTKNGFNKSPPQRRLERGGEGTMDDDVFLPSHKQNIANQAVYGKSTKAPMNNYYGSDTESLYGNSQGYNYSNAKQFYGVPNYNSDSEAFYGGQRHYKTLNNQELENLRNGQSIEIRTPEKLAPRLTRHESIQLPVPTYGYAVKYVPNQRGSFQPTSVNSEYYLQGSQNRLARSSPRRDVFVTDNIHGQHVVGYRNDFIGMAQAHPTLYSNHQGIVEPIYTTRSKQVTVRNKVCDIYGKIHDNEAQGDLQSSGVLMGQLQDSPNLNFRRGTRLTASNNDILLGRRQINFAQYSGSTGDDQLSQTTQSKALKEVPVRPLPPLPPTRKINQNENNKSSSKKQLSNSSRKKKK